MYCCRLFTITSRKCALTEAKRGSMSSDVRASTEHTGHQLFNGTRKPSRDKVIQLAFGFGLDMEQTQQLLKAAQKSPLYPKIKRDAAILYCIMHEFDFVKTQKLLGSFDIETLG